MSITGWTILAVLAVIAITVFYQKARVWGGLSLGIVIGVIIGFIYLFEGNKFAWEMIVKAAIIGALAGAVAEWLSIYLKQRRHQ